MRRPLPSLLATLSLTLAACGSSSQKTNVDCSPTSQKQSVRDLMRSWYLYPDLLQPVDPSDPAYPTVDAYLSALTAEAQAQGKDRGWTYATTASQTQAFFQEGTSVGFGVGLLQRGTQEFVSQVFPGSAAADAGFARGDEILAIGDTETTLVDVPTLIANGGLGAAFGPATAGVTRSFQVRTQVGDVVPRTMTKRTYGLDPVPSGWAVIPRDGMAPAGYVALRTFIAPAEPLLATVFAQFKAAGVQDVIVDLRYNGGGLISTAYALSNLLAADRAASDVMFRVQDSPAQSSQDSTATFAAPSQAIAPRRVAFITTGASASASELVPNALEAWKHADVALVGAKTYGKPVGQRGFVLQACDTAVYLVSFRIVNAEGDGGYFDGLPDAAGNFSGPLCDAPDDLTKALGDPAEASTAAALGWLATGTCPAPPAVALRSAPGTSRTAARAPDAYPEAIAPDEAQRHVRGLF